METFHKTAFCTLCSMNSDFFNNNSNLINMKNEMFSEKRNVLDTIVFFIQIISAIFIFCGNLLVILAVATTKTLRRVTDLYIASLALADLLVATLLIPLFIVRQNAGYWPYESHYLCIYWLSFNVFLCTASILNICCISVDRYNSIINPLKYVKKRTHRTALIVIGGVWISSLLMTLPPFFGTQHHTGVGRCYIRSDIVYRSLIGITTFVIPFVLVGFIYIRIFYVIRRRSNEIKAGKILLDLKEQRYGSFKLLFIPNNIYNHSLGRKMNCFSSRNSNQRQLFVSNYTQSNLFIAYTPSKRRKSAKEYTENQSHGQSSSTSFSNKRSEQIERECSETSSKYTQYIHMSPISMLHTTTKSDPDDFPTFSIHNSIENTEIYTLQTTDTINKTVDASMNDRQNDQQHKHEHRLNSQNERIVNPKPKYSNTHNSMIYQRRKRLVYKSEKKTVKTVALVVCCFILCWLPFTILYFMEGACECLFSEEIFIATGWIAYFNSMCNPIIYGFCNTKYAKAFKHLLHIRINS